MPDQPTPPGRRHNARPGKDEPEPVEERPPSEAELDSALADTFPASDPVSLHVESENEQRKSGDAPQPPEEAPPRKGTDR